MLVWVWGICVSVWLDGLWRCLLVLCVGGSVCFGVEWLHFQDYVVVGYLLRLLALWYAVCLVVWCDLVAGWLSDLF